VGRGGVRAAVFAARRRSDDRMKPLRSLPCRKSTRDRGLQQANRSIPVSPPPVQKWARCPGVAGWIFAPEGGEALQHKYAAALLADFVTRVQTDIEHFDFDRDYSFSKSELAPTLNATDSDLSRFAARGGKLILWHGWGSACRCSPCCDPSARCPERPVRAP
jgi:hypothetical protein